MSNEKRNIGFIGCGRMATAMARGLVAAQFCDATAIRGSDPSADCRQKFQKESGAAASGGNRDVAGWADAIVLAVKPQHMADVLEDLKSVVTDKQLVISVAAGVPLAKLLAAFGDKARAIRVMP